jgi:PAS domain S-box-containing protein
MPADATLDALLNARPGLLEGLADDHRRMLHRAVEASKDGILVADARLPDDPIVYANPAFEQLTGYPIDEVVGRNCRFLQRDDRAQPGLPVLRAALDRREPVQVVLRNYRKDGSPFWNELRIAPVADERGRITHFVGIQTDISERIAAAETDRRYQGQLEARVAELEEAHARLAAQAADLSRMTEELAAARDEAVFANRAKSEFVAVMSHELRTPLNAILGFSEVIADLRFGADSVGRYADYARDIHAAGRHLLDLINDVLDLAKVESGKLELQFAWIDPGAALGQAVRLVRQRAQERGLALAYRAAEGLPPVWADERALVQIVFNLVSNAIKFTPPGGDIAVTAEPAGPGGGTTIRVADTGDGIPPDELDRVTRPFERLSNRLDISRNGTGLGLALVRRLADLHGGSVTLESTVGCGTTVTLSLPPGPKEAPEAG